MSANRRKRSREEQEVQNVLSPTSIETVSDTEDHSPSITAHAIAPQATISKESLKEISGVFSESLSKVFKKFGIGQEPNDDDDENDYYDYDYEDDYENYENYDNEGIEHVQELPNGRPTHSATNDMFGLDINEVPDKNNNSKSMPPKSNISNSLSNPVINAPLLWLSQINLCLYLCLLVLPLIGSLTLQCLLGLLIWWTLASGLMLTGLQLKHSFHLKNNMTIFLQLFLLLMVCLKLCNRRRPRKETIFFVAQTRKIFCYKQIKTLFVVFVPC